MDVRRRKGCSGVFAFWLLIAGVPVHAEESYTWAVVPQFTGTVVHRDWTPLLQAIEKATGYKLTLTLYDSISAFEIGFLAGKPDFAYMNPYHAVMARRMQGYEPLVRDETSKLTGIIVTRVNSGLDSVEDLARKEIVFPSPNAFAASLYVRALLTENEKLEFTPIYTQTHSNAYRYVLVGKAAASGGVLRTLRRERPEVQSELKVIYETPGTPSHPIVYHKRVPKHAAQAVQKAVFDFSRTEDGKKILEAILIPSPVVASYDDYQPLEALNLEKYVVDSK